MKKEEKGNVLNCDIVRDLLPLYCDGVVSEASKTAVEEHLSGCEGCSVSLSELQKTLPTDKITKDTTKSFVDKLKKITRKYRRTFSVTLILIFVVALFLIMFTIEHIQLSKKVWTNPDTSEINCYGVYPYDLDDTTYYVAFIDYPTYYSDIEIVWSYNSAPKYCQLDLGFNVMMSEYDKKQYDGSRKTAILFYDYEELSNRISINGLNPYISFFDQVKNESFLNMLFRRNKEYGNEAVPEFVSYYVDYMTNEDTEIKEFILSVENERMIKAKFKDGSFIIWNFDGERISEN